MKKVNWFNVLVVLTMLISGVYLLHDLIVWAIMPLFTGKFICLTYFGFFTDLIAIFMLEASIQYLVEWFKK